MLLLVDDTVVYSAAARSFGVVSDCVLYAFTDAGSSASLRWSYNLSVNITYGNGAHSNIIVDNGVLYRPKVIQTAKEVS